MRVYLVGFMSAGKTTLGFQLARHLRMRFMDLDQCISETEGDSVQDIFEKYGETYFRKKEQQALHNTFTVQQTVIATGGGTPVHFDNMEQMIKHGLTFYLQLPRESIIKRLEKSARERPLIKNKSQEELNRFIEELFEQRKAFYEKAHFEVDASNKNALHYITRILSGYMY
ncbi:shikimate kinase [Salinivirga cyanobacteriivorans]|uniref:Shikimate kinase n=1 Tax=Salinivirga cyanobacteriivorans TaxID=1307839 RepID=A0A0S2I1H9_9BACT|nr:shikimate kinase [Salinivirga cyanobacteriivorans]ALO16217.1 Shikimate kinase [Salinivirga cyanobacteriivorans]